MLSRDGEISFRNSKVGVIKVWGPSFARGIAVARQFLFLRLQEFRCGTGVRCASPPLRHVYDVDIARDTAGAPIGDVHFAEAPAPTTASNFVGNRGDAHGRCASPVQGNP